MVQCNPGVISRFKQVPCVRLGIGIITLAIMGAVQPASAVAVSTGDIVSIVKTSGGLFAATASDGVFMSADNGASWTAKNGGLTDLTMSSLKASTAGTLFAQSGLGISRSATNGQTWVPLDTSTEFPLGLGLFTVASTGDLYSVGTDGLYRSTNAGDAWTLVKNGYAPSRLFAGSAGTIYAPGESGVGLMRCADNGATWTMVDSMADVIQVVAVSGTELFASTNDYASVYRSTNNGLVWKKLSIGLASIQVYDLSPDGAGDVLAATNNGIYRLAKDTDEWRRTNNDLTDTIVKSVAVSGAFIVAGTKAPGRIVQMDNLFLPTIGLPAPKTEQINTTDMLTAIKMPNGPFFLGMPDGVYRSSDTGKTWYRMVRGMGADSGSVTALTLTGKRLFAVAQYGKLFRSLDDGARWVYLNMQVKTISACSNGRIVISDDKGMGYSDDGGSSWTRTSTSTTTLAFARDTTGVLYALGTTVFRSADNGALWTKTTDIAGINTITCAAVASGGAVHIGTSLTGAYRSVDNGAVFSNFSAGLHDTNKAIIRSMTANKKDQVFAITYGYLYRLMSGKTVWAKMSQGPFNLLVAADDGTIFTVDRKGGIAPVNQEQGNWYVCDTIAAKGITRDFAVMADGTVFAATDSGLYKSTDNGKSWARSIIKASLTNKQVSMVAALSSGTLLAKVYTPLLGGAGIFRSTNKGQTWSDVSFVGNNPMSFSPEQFVATPTGTIYAPALLGTEVYRSADDGVSWTLLEPAKHGFASKTSSFYMTANANGVYVSADSGYYRSTDNGATWSRASTFCDVTVAGTDVLKSGVSTAGSPTSGALFAVGDSGIFRSNDNGTSWQYVNREITYGSRIFVNAQGYVFVCKTGSQNLDPGVGLYYSTDNGGTWNDLTKGQDNRSVTRAACGPGGELFAAFGSWFQEGTPYRYEGALIPVGIKSNAPQNHIHPVVSSVYHHSFGTGARIGYAVPRSTDLVSLAIYNIDGRLVRTLVNSRQTAGLHQVTWNGASDQNAPVVSGCYVFRLRIGTSINTGSLMIAR